MYSLTHSKVILVLSGGLDLIEFNEDGLMQLLKIGGKDDKLASIDTLLWKEIESQAEATEKSVSPDIELQYSYRLTDIFRSNLISSDKFIDA